MYLIENPIILLNYTFVEQHSLTECLCSNFYTFLSEISGHFKLHLSLPYTKVLSKFILFGNIYDTFIASSWLCVYYVYLRQKEIWQMKNYFLNNLFSIFIFTLSLWVSCVTFFQFLFRVSVCLYRKKNLIHHCTHN